MSKNTERGIGGLIAGIIAVIVVIILLCSSLTVVGVGSTGVVKRFGAVTGTTLDEGLHFKMPFIESVVDMSNKVQRLDVDAAATSKDLQAISTSIAVNYHLAAEASANMYRNIGGGYVDTLLTPAVQESVKNVMAQYRAEQLITTRSVVSVAIGDELIQKMSEYGVVIDEFNIVNFTFSSEFDAAIEAKQVAEQNKIKAQTEKEQRVIEAEAAASEKTIAAQAEADAILAKAEAEAEAIRLKAEAEAEANRKLDASLTAAVLQRNQIERWNGILPTVTSDGSNLLIDVKDLQGKNTPASVPTE